MVIGYKEAPSFFVCANSEMSLVTHIHTICSLLNDLVKLCKPAYVAGLACKQGYKTANVSSEVFNAWPHSKLY